MAESGEEMSQGSQEEEDWMDSGWAQPPAHWDLPPHVTPSSSTAKDVTPTAASTQEKLDSDGAMVKRMLLNDNKAGMEGLDKEKINQIIYEASKGSKFYENERSKEEQMKRRIDEQIQKKKNISTSQLQHGVLEADRLLEDFEAQRDLSRTIVHIDMDAFYAAVEMRDKPELKSKPMAVGGNDMLSTSNYHARKFGVRAAMPGFIAKKLCPQLVIVSLNFDKYKAVSKQVRSVMSEYDPNFCPMSLDEAYLDISDHLLARQSMLEAERTVICRDASFIDSPYHCVCDLNQVIQCYTDKTVCVDGCSMNLGEFFQRDDVVEKCCGNTLSVDGECTASVDVACPSCGKKFPPFVRQTFGCSDEEAVRECRMKIEQRTRLTASAGIAPNMMLAKVCSDRNKPNGQYKIQATVQAVMDFVRELPTRKVSGIGKVSEAMLNALGVYTCKDLYEKRGLLYHLYSTISFNYFMRICLGIGSTTIERDSVRKSMSTERTFSELSKPADLYQKCEELCDSLVEDLETEQLKGKTVSIKIKTIKFEVKTRAHSLQTYTRNKSVIFQAACDLLRTEIQLCSPQPLRLRLMGVRMSGLQHESFVRDQGQNTIVNAFKKLTDRLTHSGKIPSPSHGESLPDIVNTESLDDSVKVDPEVCTTDQADQCSEIVMLSAGREDRPKYTSAIVSQVEGGGCDNSVYPSDGIRTTTGIVRLNSNHVNTKCDLNESKLVNTSTSNSAVISQCATDCRMNCSDADSHISFCTDLNTSQCQSKQDIVSTCHESLVPSFNTFEGCPNVLADTEENTKLSEVDESEYINGSDSVDTFEEETGFCSNDGIGCDNLEGRAGISVTSATGVDGTKHLRTPSGGPSLVSVSNSSETVIEDISKEESVGTKSNAQELGPVVKEEMTDKKSAVYQGVLGSSTSEPPIRATRSGLVRNTNASKRRQKGKLTYTCPICSQDILCLNLNEFNVHVDDCLKAEVPPVQTISSNKHDNGCTVPSVTTCDAQQVGVEHQVTQTNEQYIGPAAQDLEPSYDAEAVHFSKQDSVAGRDPLRHALFKDSKIQGSDFSGKYIGDNKGTNCSTGYDAAKPKYDITEDTDGEKNEKLEPNDNGKFVYESQSAVHCLSGVDKGNHTINKTKRIVASSTSVIISNDCDTLDAANEGCNEDGRNLDTNIDSFNVSNTLSQSHGCFKSDLPEVELSEVEPESALLVCPVCNVEQRSSNLSEFNAHVDSCLSRKTISSILQEERNSESQKLKRSQPTGRNDNHTPKRRKASTSAEVQGNKIKASPSTVAGNLSILSFFRGKSD